MWEDGHMEGKRKNARCSLQKFSLVIVVIAVKLSYGGHLQLIIIIEANITKLNFFISFRG